MNYKKLIAITIALTVCALVWSNVTAHGGGGGGGHGGAASVEAADFAAAVASPSVEPALTVAGFMVALTAVAFVAVAFVMVAFAAVGSTIATSTIGSSSLAILGTRSFTIPIHTTDTIPTAIIFMVTDTAALAAVAFVAVAFAVATFVAVDFAAVADPYNQPVYQGSAGYGRGEVDSSVRFSKTGE